MRPHRKTSENVRACPKFQTATRKDYEDIGALKFCEKNPTRSPMQQRPVQQLMRRKPAPKAEHPIKSEPKVVKSEPKVVKEVKKQEEEKKPAPPPAPVEQTSHGGRYELSERMTRMVETELRDIMIKVWQELPDNPSDEAEALVVDKLRNKAGDDLRNVLGLNITKRLLNVYNPLYVKVQFSGKPEKPHLAEFLKKYNFNAFKRIEKSVNMFAAQVRTISDFDRICTDKEIKCGSIKVTVNPIYSFTKCPPNLVTSFNDNEKDNSESTKVTEANEKMEMKSEKIRTPVKDENKSENLAKVEGKTVENKTAVAKPDLESKPAVAKPVAGNKTAVNKPIVQKKTITNKVVNENQTSNTKLSVEKSAVENKSDTNKSATVNKQPIENKEVKKAAMANSESNEITKKPTQSPVKTPQKGKAIPQTKQAEQVLKKPNKVEDDYDELDDHDILALMSEGIVLDECSGSDDE